MQLPHDEAGTTGPAVVLLHAGIADRSMWSELLPQVAAAGYRAIAPDLPEFGEAELAPGCPPYRAVLDTMDSLGIAEAVLVGVSYGGAVALRVAAVAPERLAGLALISTPPLKLAPSERLQKAWQAEEAALQRGDIDEAVTAVVDAWTLPDAPDELRERIAHMQRRAFERQLGVEPPDFPDPLDAGPEPLRGVAAPVLIAAGDRDLPDFRDGMQELAELFQRPEVVTIPDAGHLAPLEQPVAFLRLLLAYLRDSAAARPRD